MLYLLSKLFTKEPTDKEIRDGVFKTFLGKKYIEEGVKAAQDGNYDLAIEKATWILENVPKIGYADGDQVRLKAEYLIQTIAKIKR